MPEEIKSIPVDSMSEKKHRGLLPLRKSWPFLVILLLTVIAGEYAGFKLIKQYDVTGSADTSPYDTVLSDAEKQEWATRQAQPHEVFIQLNTVIEVREEQWANLRLINPPYSRYQYHVTLTLVEQSVVLWQADMDPGTVLEYVELQKPLEPGEYNAVVSYDFLDSRGRVAGSHQTDVVLRAAVAVIDEENAGG